jgi:hypothetical protein
MTGDQNSGLPTLQASVSNGNTENAEHSTNIATVDVANTSYAMLSIAWHKQVNKVKLSLYTP